MNLNENIKNENIILKKENEDDLLNNENINEKERDDNKNADEDDDKYKESKIDINSLKVEELKNELKKRNIGIPKNAKKKDLQELLLNSNK